ncbi:vinculin, putative [Ixodes scapularis]|uniref:Vinculin n=1 Tax=Ixodes scapularis TaxID=6945 RepID=B7Q5X7_IXOSC|nr:vinculin, putative [Ixodes scapularis]|eukprot:XP_002411832.1 vinculin, putative [Ixodes scapularis]
MPVFHTKTIESILEPVAQQVSRLVILHEEAEDGNAMPDLERPVKAVSMAVSNLVKVGRETINSSDDQILRQDMPAALHRVEQSSKLLEEASALLKADPYSQPARKKLIEGARGILQGTSALLLCFDESEVRKIIRECKKVLDYLAVSEVIESMEDLVQFVKDMSPCLTKVSRDVDAREKELTHQVHREILVRCLDSVKVLAPILICSMKIFVQILAQSGKGVEEAAENRNYLALRMTEEINEIVRVLQLTTYDEEEWDADNLTVMKKAQNAIAGKLQSAHDWLEDPTAVTGGVGEKSVRHILEYAKRVADRSLPADADAIRKLCGDLESMTNALCELRQEGKGGKFVKPTRPKVRQNCETDVLWGCLQAGVVVHLQLDVCPPVPGGASLGVSHFCCEPVTSLSVDRLENSNTSVRQLCDLCCDGPNGQDVFPQLLSRLPYLLKPVASFRPFLQGTSPQAQSLARGVGLRLRELNQLLSQAITNVERSGIQQLAHTVGGRVEQALKWLVNPGLSDRGLGEHAIQLTVEEGRRTAESCPMPQRAEIVQLCNEIDSLTRKLKDLCRRGQGNSPEAQQTARLISSKLLELKNKIQKALVNRVVEDFIDITTPLKLFTEAVHAPEGTPNREANFQDKARNLTEFSQKAARTARNVALGGASNKKLAEALLSSAAQVESLTPQLVNAGRIRMTYPDNKAADEHFENLHKQYSESMMHMRNLADEATDTASFVKVTADNIWSMLQSCAMKSINIFRRCSMNTMYRHTQNAARETSKPGRQSCGSNTFWVRWQHSNFYGSIIPAVTPMIQNAKAVATKITDPVAQTRWRESNKAVMCRGCTFEVCILERERFLPRGPLGRLVRKRGLDACAPYFASIAASFVSPKSLPIPFDKPLKNLQASLLYRAKEIAAHGLHQEVRQWSSKDNEIIAAAKRMAILMARLSQLVRGEGGTKKDLIACAKQIAEASEEVTRLAKELARMCTDKRMRTNILQVCERIPTIGTQLRILSTVKATMLGAQGESGTEEDQEATDMLVGNAQNLMQSVKETVRACEAASIKIRTDSGLRVRWIRKQPWYQY